MAEAMLQAENRVYHERIAAQVGRDDKTLSKEIEKARRNAWSKATEHREAERLMLSAENKVRSVIDARPHSTVTRPNDSCVSGVGSEPKSSPATQSSLSLRVACNSTVSERLPRTLPSTVAGAAQAVRVPEGPRLQGARPGSGGGARRGGVPSRGEPRAHGRDAGGREPSASETPADGDRARREGPQC